MSISMLTFFLAVGLAALADSSVIPYSRIRSIFPNGRIVGGQDTTIEENPWQASLQIYGFSYCGASIVSNEWVITAGHCAGYPASSVTVKAGTSYKTTGGSSHPAIKIIRHEDYRTNRYGVPENDVALIKVGEPFVLDATRKPIIMFRHQEEALDGVLTIITGWGAVREGGSSSEILQTVRVPIVSKPVCDDAYKLYGGLPEGQICAAHPQGGKDACQGDSGGPLTIGGRLAGIVSWGNGCARPGYPGVYTEVAAYRNWITTNIGI